MMTRSADNVEVVTPKMQGFRDDCARNKMKRERLAERLTESAPKRDPGWQV